MISEDTLRGWAQPPSDTESTKADNAERVIREALQSASGLSKYSLRVFTQGSYKANTNVRLDSDVDISVLCTDQYYYDFTLSDMTPADLAGGSGTVTPDELRNAVEEALVDRFGRGGVTRGNKAFDVHANTYRIDADVVVAFQHKRFRKRAEGGITVWDEGIQFFPDAGLHIVNWPAQNCDNGTAKNNRTNRRYKAGIRILKRARNAMQEARISAAANVASFLIESLVWNVPDSAFNTDTYQAMLRNILIHAYNDTKSNDTCSEWGEVNELKYLFRPSQPWTREQANAFLQAVWNYCDMT
jgi:hypothetical protein